MPKNLDKKTVQKLTQDSERSKPIEHSPELFVQKLTESDITKATNKKNQTTRAIPAMSFPTSLREKCQVALREIRNLRGNRSDQQFLQAVEQYIGELHFVEIERLSLVVKEFSLFPSNASEDRFNNFYTHHQGFFRIMSTTGNGNCKLKSIRLLRYN